MTITIGGVIILLCLFSAILGTKFNDGDYRAKMFQAGVLIGLATILLTLGHLVDLAQSLITAK